MTFSGREFISDKESQMYLKLHGLDAKEIQWEDTARNFGSCVGPNITDLTLRANGENMPIIGYPNFEDYSCDHHMDTFQVTVGNESGKELRRIPLREYLTNLNVYTDASVQSLRPNDDVVLCSAQACMLPLKSGSVKFNVRLRNYQSQSNDPAVLVIVSTAQGTSSQVVYGTYNSPTTDVYFNSNGRAFNFKATRLQDDRRERGIEYVGEPTIEERDRNLILVIQIPLKQKIVTREYNYVPACGVSSYAVPACGVTRSFDIAKGMDYGMVSTGDEIGPFKSLSNYQLTRDDRYPIRVTVHRYYVTDHPKISEVESRTIANDIRRVFDMAVAKGSLVVSENTGRSTAPVKTTPQPPLTISGRGLVPF